MTRNGEKVVFATPGRSSVSNSVRLLFKFWDGAIGTGGGWVLGTWGDGVWPFEFLGSIKYGDGHFGLGYIVPASTAQPTDPFWDFLG